MLRARTHPAERSAKPFGKMFEHRCDLFVGLRLEALDEATGSARP
jgi:hypothetical protein